MDGKHFDQITKAFAEPGSRRSLLRRGLGAVLGGALVGAGLDRAHAAALRAPGQVCRKNGDCASGMCGPRDTTGRGRCLCDGPEDCPSPIDKCKPAVCLPDGTCGSETTFCDPSDLCKINHRCDPNTGQCVFTPVVCDDNNPCTIDTCDPQTGECRFSPKICDDNNPCTTDFCDVRSGECVHTPKNCDDNNPCTLDTCDPQTGQCIHTPIECDENN